MNNKILIDVYIPGLDVSYNIWIPFDDVVGQASELICKTVNDLADGQFNYDKGYVLIDADSGQAYDLNSQIKDTNIRNGKKIIIM